MTRLFIFPIAILGLGILGCSNGTYENPDTSVSASNATSQTQTESKREQTQPPDSEGRESNEDSPSADDRDVMQTLREARVIFTKSSDKTRIHAVTHVALRDREKFDAVLDAIGSCPEIKSLNMKSSLVTDDDLKKIVNLPSIISLTLNETKITDKGVELIARMENLETLYLSDTAITNASIPFVAKLEKLRILDLSNGHVTGALEPIATLPQLNWLLLCGLTIKDGSLAGLGASQSLSRLTLSESKIVDKQSLASFESSASGVTIDR